MRGNPGNLRRAAAAKSAAAQARAQDGLEQMLRRGDPITFRGLAQTAGVSLDFLYRTGEIRSRVEQLRARQQTAPPAPAQAPGPDQPGSVIRTLTAQLAELKRRHRDEISTLRQALEAAHERTSNSGAASATGTPQTRSPEAVLSRTRPQAIYQRKHYDKDHLPRITRRWNAPSRSCRSAPGSPNGRPTTTPGTG